MEITKFWHWICDLFKEVESLWTWFTSDIGDIPFVGDVLESILSVFGVESLTPLWLITFGIGILIIVKFALLFK